MNSPPSPCYQPEWIYRRIKSPEDNPQIVPLDDTAWPNVIQPRSKADRSVPMLGLVNTSSHPRRRGPSVSSIPSMTSASSASTSSLSRGSQSKAKPILARSPSASTKNSLAKSVKFVDKPTIHYAYDNRQQKLQPRPQHRERPVSRRPPTPPESPKIRLTGRIKQFIWPSHTNQKAPDRPIISAPFVLGNIPSFVDQSDNGSIRSTRSNNSTRSERLRPRMSAPISLRMSNSVDNFRTAKSSSGGRSKFRAFLGKMVT
jgi:hypothetical protein